MKKSVRFLVAGSAALLTVACAERISGAFGASALDVAFTSTPLGFESTASSFSSPAGGGDAAFMMGGPGGPGGERGGPRGPNGLPGSHDFMGGGFRDDFLGGPMDGGRPFDRDGAFSSCVFAASTGVVTCAPEMHGGLTITRTVIFRDAAGTAQAARDSLTNSISTHVAVTGTVTRRDSSVTTVSHASDRLVTGVTKGSTSRTVNGTSAGTESSTGRDSAGTFAVSRVVGDTTSGLVVPVAEGRPSYPTAGVVIRAMSVTRTYTGQSPTNSNRREVITYDGSATAKLVITRDGTTKTCTLPLPHGRPTCS